MRSIANVQTGRRVKSTRLTGVTAASLTRCTVDPRQQSKLTGCQHSEAIQENNLGETPQEPQCLVSDRERLLRDPVHFRPGLSPPSVGSSRFVTRLAPASHQFRKWRHGSCIVRVSEGCDLHGVGSRRPLLPGHRCKVAAASGFRQPRCGVQQPSPTSTTRLRTFPPCRPGTDGGCGLLGRLAPSAPPENRSRCLWYSASSCVPQRLHGQHCLPAPASIDCAKSAPLISVSSLSHPVPMPKRKRPPDA